MANLSAGEDDIEQVLEVILEELTNAELLDLEQNHKTEEDAREKDPAGEGKDEPSRNFSVKDLDRGGQTF